MGVVTIAWVELLPVICVRVAMLVLVRTLTQTPVSLEHTVWMLPSTALCVKQVIAVLTLQVSAIEEHCELEYYTCIFY